MLSYISFGDILDVTDMGLLKLPDGTGQHLAYISRFGPEKCCSRKLQCNTDMVLIKLPFVRDMDHQVKSDHTSKLLAKE